MSNLTELEDNPYEDDVLDNITYYRTPLGEAVFYWTAGTHIINFFLCIVNISAGIFLMVMITKYKKLKTKENMYIFHLCLYHVLYYLLPIVLHILVELLDYRLEMWCTVHNVDNILLSFVFIFAVILALDWYLTNFRTLLPIKYERLRIFVLVVVYSLGFIKFLAGIILCRILEDPFDTWLNHCIMYLIHTIALVAIGVINYLRNKNAKTSQNPTKVDHILNVANYVVLAWLLLAVYAILERMFDGTSFYSDYLRYFIVFTYFIAYYLANSDLIVIVYMLGRMNKEFKMAYKMALKKKFKQYDHNDLDHCEDETSVHHRVDSQTIDLSS